MVPRERPQTGWNPTLPCTSALLEALQRDAAPTQRPSLRAGLGNHPTELVHTCAEKNSSYIHNKHGGWASAPNCIWNINPILKRELYLTSLLYSDRLIPNELILAGKGIGGDIADAQKAQKLAGASPLSQDEEEDSWKLIIREFNVLLYFVGCICSDFPCAHPWSHISLLTGRIHWLQHYKNYKIVLFYNDYCSCPCSLLSCFLTLLNHTFCTPTLFPEIARKSEFFETSNFCDCSVNSSLRHSSDRFQIENPTP